MWDEIQDMPGEIFDICSIALATDFQMMKLHMESDLQCYMCDTQLGLEDCVDWVCDRFNLDCTDDLVDWVADVYDAFWGN
jgi:hypothetical protein